MPPKQHARQLGADRAGLDDFRVAAESGPQIHPELRAGNNALRARLDAAAEALGISLDDLTVLAPQNDPYRRDTAAGHRDAAWLAEQVARLVPHGDIHLRGLHYKLVGTARKPDGTPYVNNDTTWQWLQEKPAKAARWLGYVPFDRIRDERNGAPEIFVRGDDGSSGWGSLSDGGGMLELPALSSVLPSVLAIPPRPRQPYRIVLIGEKSSLAAELLPVANRADELVLPTGEASDTLIAEMAARADQDGRPTIVLYFADFDPAGWQMPVSVSRKLQALRDLHHPDLQIDVHRVCLTLDQVRAFDLPSSPLKETERRGDRWVAIMRRAQTEIDALAALHPGAIGRLAEDAIAPFFEFDPDQAGGGSGGSLASGGHGAASFERGIRHRLRRDRERACRRHRRRRGDEGSAGRSP